MRPALRGNPGPRRALHLDEARGTPAASPAAMEGCSAMDDKTTHVWDMMKKIDYCMLVTSFDDGMRARPMSSIVRQDEDAIYFLTEAGSEKVADIEGDDAVLLNYSDGSTQFVSTMATARIARDRALIKRLWNVGAQAFWPEGPETAKVAVIAATPHAAEYWDGPSGIIGAAKMAIALVRRTTPDLGENEKVRM
jgi:general stress protein 26